MAYIRSKKEELTGYQASGEIRPSVDLGCDFIMVYGIDPTMPERIRQYREKGYVIHLMTGIAWGEYQEYLKTNNGGEMEKFLDYMTEQSKTRDDFAY